MHRIRQLIDVFYQCRVIGTLSLWLIDISDNSGYCLRCRLQPIQPGFIKSDLVIVDASNKTIQRTCYSNAALDIRHVRTAMQRVTGAMQSIGDIERRLVPFTGLKIVDDDLHMTGRFLRENIQQYRIHLERWLFLDSARLFRCRNHQDCGIRVTLGERIGSRHNQACIGSWLGTNFELLDKLRYNRCSGDDKIDHWRRLNERPIDQPVEEVFDTPAVLANSLGTDHSATAFKRMKRTPDRD